MVAWGQVKFYLFKRFVCVCEWVKVLAMLKGEGYNSFEGWGRQVSPLQTQVVSP